MADIAPAGRAEMTWQHELDELRRKRDLAKRMGGEAGIARQRGQGRLTVRERVELLLDPFTFQEAYTSLGDAQYDEESGELRSFRPGNTVAGYGRINGRTVCVRGDDFTIRGGSSDSAGAAKRRIEQTAGDMRVPLVLLLDGAGGSVREVGGRSAAPGDEEHTHEPADDSVEPLVPLASSGVPGSLDVSEQFELPVGSAGGANDLATLLSRGNLLAQVPVMTAALGSCAGWIAIAAAESHFSVMTRDTSELFVAGPPLVKQALAIDLPKHQLGSYEIHARMTGVIQNVADDEEDALRQIRTCLSYLPQNVWELPPRAEPRDDANRREEELLSIIPRDRRKTYDIRHIIALVVDAGSVFEIAPLFGPSLVTVLARIDGFPVAMIANDCRHDGGAQTAAACQKFERFVDFADTFHVPVVYLCDVPGFMIGPESEKQGTIRWASRANIAVREATVPYLTIIVRRFYGVAVGGAKRGPGMNAVYGWPSAESGSLPAAGGVMAAYRRMIEASPDPEATRIELEERLNRMASVLRRPGFVEEIIDPRDTRPLVVEFVRRAQSVISTQLGPKLRVGMRP